MSTDDTPHPSGETPKQRRDRELMELLNELRLAAPGVQVVFGFLLVVPFNSRFGETSSFERGAYITSLILITTSAILLLGASVQHRLLFRRHFEARMLVTANALALAGLTCLGLGMITAVVLVTQFLFGPVASISIGTAAGALLVVVWYALPLRRRRTALSSAVDDQ